MGLLRDALGAAMGSSQVNNGFSGKHTLPWASNSSQSNTNIRQFDSTSSPSTDYDSSPSYSTYQDTRHVRHRQDRTPMPYIREDDVYSVADNYYNPNFPVAQPLTSRNPPPYESLTIEQRRCPELQSYNRQQQYGCMDYGNQYGCVDYGGDGPMAGMPSFRPLALPQIAYGDGQPFLRAYSAEMGRYNISMRDFVQVLDAINVAIIPSPENQIFQKAATIGGFFIPGAGGIGLMAGQVAVGLGVAAGHASQLSKVLSRANLNLFLPNGLEIGIGKSTNVDAEVGIAPGAAKPGTVNASAEERISCYGDYLCPISHVLPPLQNNGRTDPIAMLGRGLSNKTNQKKLDKAQEDVQKGEHKDLDKVEKAVKWIIVRRASPEALAHLTDTAPALPTGRNGQGTHQYQKQY